MVSKIFHDRFATWLCTRCTFVLLLILVTILFMAAGCTSLRTADPSSLNYPPLDFSIPEVDRFVLDNGIVTYFMRDDELPIVNMTLMVRAGSIYEFPDKEGLAELTGRVMRTGGVSGMSGDDLDSELDDRAIDLSVSVGKDIAKFSLSVLKKDIEKGAHILSRIITAPNFENEKLELARELKLEALRRVNDNPQELAFREFVKLVYFGDPRGNLPTLESVGRIERSDLVLFHKTCYFPGNMMIAVSGDIEEDKAASLLNRLMGSWDSPGKIPSASRPLPHPATLNYFDKKNPQSIIIRGTIAPGKKDGDYFAFTVLDFILGSGGFRSRITSEIRNRMGLAYSAGSFYSTRPEFGLSAAYVMTGSGTTGRAMESLNRIIEKAKNENVSVDELKWAKDSLINSFIFSFTEAHQVVLEKALLEYEGLPADFLTSYRKGIAGVTDEDVRNAAIAYLDNKNATTLVLGDESNFDKPLSEFGTVNVVGKEQD